MSWDGRSACSRQTGPEGVVIIAPDVSQRIANRGSDDLIFLAVCTPRFTEAYYEDVESD